MAIAFKVNRVSTTENQFIVYGTLTLTGNYGGGSTHGDTLDFRNDQVKSTSVPTCVYVYEAPPAGTAANGYNFNYNPGTKLSNGVVQITNNLTEYTQGSAYSAGLLGAVVKVEAHFPRV